ncbi:MAG: DUF6112 family protein [Microbacteriaceae bacterium]
MRLTDVIPDFDAIDGTTGLKEAIGALMTFVLIAAVCMLIYSAVAWALSESHGNYQGTHRGKVGVLVAAITAAVAGAGLAWLNFLLGVGGSI